MIHEYICITEIHVVVYWVVTWPSGSEREISTAICCTLFNTHQYNRSHLLAEIAMSQCMSRVSRHRPLS